MFYPYFNTLFDDLMSYPYEKSESRTVSPAPIRTDVYESKDGYELQMELPGFSRDEIQIELSEGILTVTAAKKPAAEKDIEDQKSLRCVRRERNQVPMSRRFEVSRYLGREDMKARLENGILTICFPKGEARKPSGFITIE